MCVEQLWVGGGGESGLVQGIFLKQMQQDVLLLTQESKLQKGRHVSRPLLRHWCLTQ